MNNERVYKPAEVAEQFACSERMILNLIYSGELAAFKVGNRYRITDAAIKEYLSKNQVIKESENYDAE